VEDAMMFRGELSHMLPELHSILNLLEGGFGQLKVLVIGDIMLDRYIHGEVERISPEAPVPVIRHAQRYERAGGAANVAMNLAGLGCQTFLSGFWGNDAEQGELLAILDRAGVDTVGVVSSSLPTISKTRIVGRMQQLLRLDIESRDLPPAIEAQRLLERTTELVTKVHAVILSDYAKGALSTALCEAVIRAARTAGVPILVDPKTPDFGKYSGATSVCPNLGELSQATGISPHHTEELLAAGQALVAEHDFEFLIVTMSEKGISVLRRPSEDSKGSEGTSGIYHSPARAREVFDVSGAGDTVIATLTACLAAGLQIESAVELANLAAGIVVGKVGTVPIASHELVAALTPSSGLSAGEKILDLERIKLRVAEWRAGGETIVFTNGCFDLLHVGHITLLEDCRRFGSKLVLGLNADSSVCRLKGPTRPIVGERERARVMAALAAVDAVVLFEEDTPLELIRALRPNVLVKGGDYTIETVVGHEEVIAAGGRVEIVPTVEGFSTSNIVKKLTGNAVEGGRDPEEGKTVQREGIGK
jgi:D-beta-D-heptose 7-phosphate kinase/D-beta-D-heptose 1-phosphate adenosyltransferase